MFGDRAGNRELFFDQYCAYILLFLFNPIVTSLRGIQQASELKKVQRILGCARASLGSLSESARVFGSELMQEIVKERCERGEYVVEPDKVAEKMVWDAVRRIRERARREEGRAGPGRPDHAK